MQMDIKITGVKPVPDIMRGTRSAGKGRPAWTSSGRVAGHRTPGTEQRPTRRASSPADRPVKIGMLIGKGGETSIAGCRRSSIPDRRQRRRSGARYSATASRREARRQGSPDAQDDRGSADGVPERQGVKTAVSARSSSLKGTDGMLHLSKCRPAALGHGRGRPQKTREKRSASGWSRST